MCSDVNSKEFRKKHKSLFDKGFCARCVAILTSPLTLSPLCGKCSVIFNSMVGGKHGET